MRRFLRRKARFYAGRDSLDDTFRTLVCTLSEFHQDADLAQGSRRDAFVLFLEADLFQRDDVTGLELRGRQADRNGWEDRLGDGGKASPSALARGTEDGSRKHSSQSRYVRVPPGRLDTAQELEDCAYLPALVHGTVRAYGREKMKELEQMQSKVRSRSERKRAAHLLRLFRGAHSSPCDQLVVFPSPRARMPDWLGREERARRDLEKVTTSGRAGGSASES